MEPTISIFDEAHRIPQGFPVRAGAPAWLASTGEAFTAEQFGAVLIQRGWLVDRLGGKLFASRELPTAVIQLVAAPDGMQWRVFVACDGRAVDGHVADATTLAEILDRRGPRFLHSGGAS